MRRVGSVLRSLIALGTALLAVWLATPATPAATQSASGDQVMQRKSIVDLSEAELMSLRRGVAKMMSRNIATRGSADYRRSWIYWANMHLHFGDDCAGAISGSGMAGVQTFAASDADEMTTWCSCEHGTINFLTWHRMYLWYFERVLQEAAGDASLRIPFWDYETNGQLPDSYREATYVDETGNTVPNPLHVDARQPGLNKGTASLSSSITSTASAMVQTSFDTFSNSLETTPHNAVHCGIVTGGCPNGLMGSVPVAAIDPIFYTHHTNIDRLYDCWLQVDQPSRLPNDPDQLKTTFTFVDSDGSTPMRMVGDMLTATELGYSYASGGGCPPALQAMTAAPAIPEEAKQMANAAERPLAIAGPSQISGAVTSVPLSVEAPAQETHAPRPEGAAPVRTYLTIQGVQFDQAPGGLFDVFLQGAGGRREQVGVINFFNMRPSGSGEHAGHHAHGVTRANFRFDVTNAVRELGLSADAPPSIVFQSTDGLTGSTAEGVARQMNAAANVRFESAQLVGGP